jgi:hypothetical protein
MTRVPVAVRGRYPRRVPRRLYTPELANRSLPLVARIARDIQLTARRIAAAGERPRRPAEAHAVQDELADLRDRFDDLLAELDALGVELKDPLSGLLDFRARRGDTEVYLCWRLGEEGVDHWHTLDGGFAGRRPMTDF